MLPPRLGIWRARGVIGIYGSMLAAQEEMIPAAEYALPTRARRTRPRSTAKLGVNFWRQKMRDHSLLGYQEVAAIMGKSHSTTHGWLEKMPKPDGLTATGMPAWYMWRIWEWSDRHAHTSGGSK